MTNSWFHTTPDDTTERPTDAPVSISIVLDRSGSMASIADDVVGGFNQFLAEQRKAPGDVRVTLVQFDGHDPFELVIDGLDLKQIDDLPREWYEPRGMTPLYDAVGRMIARIDADIADRKAKGLPDEDQIVAIVTDGMENASREHTLASVMPLIEQRRTAGWVFAFLAANQDAFVEGGRLGVAQQNRAGWAASPAGHRKMWKDLSHSSSSHRAKERSRRHAEADQFHEEAPSKKKKKE